MHVCSTIWEGCWYDNVVSSFGFGRSKSYFGTPENGHFRQEKIFFCCRMDTSYVKGQIDSENLFIFRDRTISQTKFSSKVLENILCGWVMQILEENVDPSQCRGKMHSPTILYYIQLPKNIIVELM